MANPDHLAMLREGVKIWNNWRFPTFWERLRGQTVDLSHAALAGADLCGADLSYADLTEADLSGATLQETNLSFANLARANLNKADLNGKLLRGAQHTAADLSEDESIDLELGGVALMSANLSGACLEGARLVGADLRMADLTNAHLSKADLAWARLSGAKLNGADLQRAELFQVVARWAEFRKADLRSANLTAANLSATDFRGADLSGANLSRAVLVKANLEEATIRNCRVYGISAWSLNLGSEHLAAVQSNLIITRAREPVIEVDNLEVAQFLYLLLSNERVRHAIGTVTSKVVLLLGRFTPERKLVLEALREQLRLRGWLPVLFDFDPLANQARIETISTLAGLARFVIADLTDAKSVLQELERIVLQRPSLPVQPILLSSQREPGMFDSFQLALSVLPTAFYDNQAQLLAELVERVISPADAKARELERRLEQVRNSS